MGATTVEEKLSRPRALLRNQSGGDGPRPTKLPYGGLNHIRFEGCVSTIAEPARYPRFGVHFTMHGGREPATVLAAPPAAGLARRSCSAAPAFMAIIKGSGANPALQSQGRTRGTVPLANRPRPPARLLTVSNATSAKRFHAQPIRATRLMKFGDMPHVSG